MLGMAGERAFIVSRMNDQAWPAGRTSGHWRSITIRSRCASPEGFTELMQTRGIDVHPKGAADSRRTFTSERLLDMRGLKQRGIIKSYKIMKVVITEEVIEEDG
jgi:hypothetical protein